MLENSKLSSRFNKKEVVTYTATPKRFVFAKNKSDNGANDDNSEQPQIQATEESLPNHQVELNIDEIKEKFFEKISSIPVWGEYSDEQKQELVENFLDSNFNIKNGEITTQLLDSVRGFGVIDYLIKQENVSAVFVNGTNNVYIEINGKVLNTEIKPNNNQLKLIISNIENLSGKKLDISQNTMNIKCGNLLISIISPHISLSGICITIRKITDSDINMLINNEFATKEIFDFLISAINAKKNIIISGGINSGKTTLLNALLENILINKRLVLIEKTPQISVKLEQGIKFLAEPNATNFDDLLENIEKLLPEYTLTDLNISLPQIFEGSGKIATLRANSADSAFAKLVNACISRESLPEKNVKQQVLRNYDYIVQIDTIEGIRRISSIIELTPARTAALSFKTVVNWVNGSYETSFLQPLTSMLADSLISQAGSMTARFYNQD